MQAPPPSAPSPASQGGIDPFANDDQHEAGEAATEAAAEGAGAAPSSADGGAVSEAEPASGAEAASQAASQAAGEAASEPASEAARGAAAEAAGEEAANEAADDAAAEANDEAVGAVEADEHAGAHADEQVGEHGQSEVHLAASPPRPARDSVQQPSAPHSRGWLDLHAPLPTSMEALAVAVASGVNKLARPRAVRVRKALIRAISSLPMLTRESGAVSLRAQHPAAAALKLSTLEERLAAEAACRFLLPRQGCPAAHGPEEFIYAASIGARTARVPADVEELLKRFETTLEALFKPVEEEEAAWARNASGLHPSCRKVGGDGLVRQEELDWDEAANWPAGGKENGMLVADNEEMEAFGGAADGTAVVPLASDDNGSDMDSDSDDEADLRVVEHGDDVYLSFGALDADSQASLQSAAVSAAQASASLSANALLRVKEDAASPFRLGDDKAGVRGGAADFSLNVARRRFSTEDVSAVDVDGFCFQIASRHLRRLTKILGPTAAFLWPQPQGRRNSFVPPGAKRFATIGSVWVYHPGVSDDVLDAVRFTLERSI